MIIIVLLCCFSLNEPFQGCNVNLSKFDLEERDIPEYTRLGRFVKFHIDSVYGKGGGLQYLHVDGHIPGKNENEGTMLY